MTTGQDDLRSTDAVDAYREIRYEVSDPVATITFDRPAAMNGWTMTMGAEVRHAVARAEADPAVVGIILTGEGRAFCAGADMGTLTALTQGGTLGADAATAPAGPTAAPAALPDDFSGEYTYLLASPKPIVAAINGAIAGMAVPIALCCDVRFMAEDAPLLTAFAQRGLIAEWGSSWLLSRLVGPAVALDLLLSSRKIRGDEAARLGVVNAAMPADEVLAHSRRWIEDLAARCSPTSVAIMKRQVYEQLHVGLGAAERDSQTKMLESFGRPDFLEGVTSYLEKRPPQFPRIGA